MNHDALLEWLSDESENHEAGHRTQGIKNECIDIAMVRSGGHDGRVSSERSAERTTREGDAADLFAYLHAPTATCFLSLKVADLTEVGTEAKKRALDEVAWRFA